MFTRPKFPWSNHCHHQKHSRMKDWWCTHRPVSLCCDVCDPADGLAHWSMTRWSTRSVASRIARRLRGTINFWANSGFAKKFMIMELMMANSYRSKKLLPPLHRFPANNVIIQVLVALINSVYVPIVIIYHLRCSDWIVVTSSLYRSDILHGSYRELITLVSNQLTKLHRWEWRCTYLPRFPLLKPRRKSIPINWNGTASHSSTSIHIFEQSCSCMKFVKQWSVTFIQPSFHEVKYDKMDRGRQRFEYNQWTDNPLERKHQIYTWNWRVRVCFGTGSRPQLVPYSSASYAMNGGYLLVVQKRPTSWNRTYQL